MTTGFDHVSHGFSLKNKDISQNWRTTTKNNGNYLRDNFPTQKKKIISLLDNNCLWEATDRSESSLDILLDRGASEHLVSIVAFLKNAQRIRIYFVELSNGNKVIVSHRGELKVRSRPSSQPIHTIYHAPSWACSPPAGCKTLARLLQYIEQGVYYTSRTMVIELITRI